MPLCPINITLPNGALMPAVGLGTSRKILISWKYVDNDGDLEAAVEKALEVGYRHIDTATIYNSEKLIGKILKERMDSGKIRREELFVVTKLPGCGNRESAVEKFLKQSLKHLQLSYVDLYLIHSPVGFLEPEGKLSMESAANKLELDKTTDIVGIWKGMEAQVDAGRAKAIGVSNFNQNQLQRILDVARIKPAILQVELHAYFQQRPLVEFCRNNNISVVAYAPIGSPGLVDLMNKVNSEYDEPPVLLKDMSVLSIANKYNKEPAQILVRYLLQRGIGAIPKSTNPRRVASNFQVFDFELDQDDLGILDNLDLGEKGRRFDFKVFGFAAHPEYPF